MEQISEHVKMPVLTRDAFLASHDAEPQEFVSMFWGGIIRYRRATVADKNWARQRAKVPAGNGNGTEIDEGRLQCALIQRCCVEPKLEVADIEALLDKNAVEVGRLAAAIISRSDPTK